MINTIIIGLVIGLAVALAVFGLVFLIAVLPALKSKKKAEKEPEQPVAEEQVEEPKQEPKEEKAEKPEEKVEEKAEEPAEELKEEKEVKEEPKKEPAKEKQKPVEKKAQKEVAATAAVEEDEDDEEDDDVEDNETELEKEERVAAINSAPELAVNQRYNRSYIARLTQSGDKVKSWYSQIKNAIVSYKKVKSSITWRQEKFVSGGETIAKIALRGRTLCVYLALNVKNIKNADVEDVSGGAHSATPALIRIKKEQRLQEALTLIASLANKYSLEEGTKATTDYTKVYTLKTTEQLIQEGQVKVITVKVK